MVQAITLATFMERMDEKFDQITAEIANFREENKAQFEVLNLRLEKVEQRMEIVGQRLEKVEQRLEIIEQRLEKVEQRMEIIEQRLEKVEHRLEKLELRMDSLESRLESVEIRLKLVESEVIQLGERLTRLEDVTNGLLGSFVIFMNQSEIRYNETKGRFELVDGRAGTHESNQADTNLRLTSLEDALAEIRKAG